MTKKTTDRTLLACQWRDVVAINFDVDQRAITPYLPPGLRVANYHDRTMITVLAKNTRELQPYGGRLTLFRSVLSIETRCYAEYMGKSGPIVGHVVLKHLLNNRNCWYLMRFLFRQPFRVAKINHEASNFESPQRGALPTADYRWNDDGDDNHVSVSAREVARKPAENSREAFVLYQNYRFGLHKGTSIAWKIHHAPWAMWKASSGTFECSRDKLVDASFAKFLRKPSTVMMSAGGEIQISRAVPLSEL